MSVPVTTCSDPSSACFCRSCCTTKSVNLRNPASIQFNISSHALARAYKESKNYRPDSRSGGGMKL